MRAGRSTACPISGMAGRSSTSTRPTTPPAAPPRPASSATSTPSSPTWAPGSGGSARTARRAIDGSAQKFGLGFTLLSDEDHAVAEAYGAWALKKNYGREYLGIVRSTFLVGPDGRIVRAWPRVRADGHPAEVLEAIREARAAAEAG